MERAHSHGKEGVVVRRDLALVDVDVLMVLVVVLLDEEYRSHQKQARADFEQRRPQQMPSRDTQ